MQFASVAEHVVLRAYQEWNAGNSEAAIGDSITLQIIAHTKFL